MAIPRWYARGQTRPAISASAWDVLTLAGEQLPGRAKITSASVGWKIDEKKAPGKDADRPTSYGFDSRPIAFEIEVINVEEMEAVNRALAPYIPRPGGAFDPVAIDHPQLAHMVGFTAMYVHEVGAWQRNGGRMTLTVSGRTWVTTEKPPRKKGGSKVQTPKKATPPNKRAEDAKKRGTSGGSNPAPATQGGYCSPTFSPGS